jgi:tetratricopeptide (TPR) repeat protein
MMNKAAMDERSLIPQRVRFEEVTPANEPAAFLTDNLISLVAPLKLPTYDGYDDLDDLRFAFLTLPSGQTVMLGEYLNSPQPGTDLYIDARMQHSPQVVFESCQYLNISRSRVAWFHPDFQEEIDQLYTNNPHNLQLQTPLQIEEFQQPSPSEPIDCFNHALRIYDRDKFPQYWAMLQRNLGLAYYHRIEGDRQENLERAIVCFKNALEIHTTEEFSDQREIDNQNLATVKESLYQFNQFNKAIIDHQLMSVKIVINGRRGSFLPKVKWNYWRSLRNLTK